jgi:hypothetical protein
MSSSTRCDNVTFQWRDVLPIADSNGACVNCLPVFGNDGSATINLPAGFTFQFGGQPYTQITVSANGYIAFDGVGSERENFLIPNPDIGSPYRRSNWFVAPFWDDLTLSASVDSRVLQATYGSGQQREFVIEWYKVPIQKNNTSTLLTFQVVLSEADGSILFQYLDLNGSQSDGSSATVGLEYNDGYSGISYAYNRRGALKAGQTIRFAPHPPGATSSVAGCQISTLLQSGQNTYEMDPFCLTLPDALLQDLVSQQGRVRMTTFSNFTPLPSFHSLSHFAEITLVPMPHPPLSPPPTVCYHYTARDVVQAGGRPQNLFIAVYDAETNMWQRLFTAVDLSQQVLVANVPHFSIFGVFANANPLPENLPVTGAPGRATWDWGLIVTAVLLGAWGIWRRK